MSKNIRGELDYTKIVKYMRRTANMKLLADRIIMPAYSEKENIEKRFGEIVHISPVFHHPNFSMPLQIYFVKLKKEVKNEQRKA
jgi:hypothetical protein